MGEVWGTMARLTDRAVKAAEPGRHSDGQGLLLEVSKTLTRRWLFRFQLNGKRRDLGLGGYPDVSLAQARIAAASARAAVKAGQDPVEAKSAAAPEERKIPTFKYYAEMVIAAQKTKTTNAKVRYQWERHLGPVYCGSILDKPINTIRTTHVFDLLTPVWHTKPELARKLLPAIRKVCEVARIRLRDEYDIDYSNPAQWADLRAMGLETPVQLSRGHHPSLPYQRLPELMKVLRETEQVSSLALQFLILTVARTDAVINCRWPDIDAKARVWSIPLANLKDKRTRKEVFRVPLSDAAMRVLDIAKSIRVSEWVFPGSRNQGRSLDKDAPMSNMSMTELMKRLDRADRAGGFTDPDTGKRAVPHGFRASFKGFARETRQDRELVEECLGHAIGGRVERAYDRVDVLEQRRAVMNAWAVHCEPAKAKNVVQLKRKA